MTTDRRLWCLALPLVGVGWIVVLAGVMRLGGGAPAALVVLPPDGFVAALPDGIAVISGGPYGLTVKGDRPDLAAVLYSLGARLVLPAGLRGCLPRAG